MTKIRVLFGLAAIAIAYGLYLGFTAPPDALQGEYSRIINIHVPASWLAFLAFGVTAFGSVLWLARKRARWDRLAAASAEIGVLFTSISILTGMIWGNAVWGVPWDWGDPRMMTTAVMLFVYLGYLALRSAIVDPVVRARRAAILGTIAVIQVPLVYFSVNIWRSIHQTQSLRPDGSTMPDEMLIAMLVNVLAFTVLYVALLLARIDVSIAEEARETREVLAGEEIDSPRIEGVSDV